MLSLMCSSQSGLVMLKLKYSIAFITTLSLGLFRPLKATVEIRSHLVSYGQYSKYYGRYLRRTCMCIFSTQANIVGKKNLDVVLPFNFNRQRGS